MNGRIYDPGIGRFLTADSFIQFSGNSQSYNRYAYVLNNPMRYSDPSGHFVSLAVGFALSYAASTGVAISMEVLIVSMFFAGMADAMIAGADLEQALKAGAFTALSAAVAYGIGTQFEGNAFADGNWFGEGAFRHELARAMSHGIAQGTISEVAGGDFGSGAAGGFFGSFAGKISDGMGLNDGASFVAAVAIGGTTAEIGGGKFANGAMTASFVFLFNQLRNTNPNNSKIGTNYLKEEIRKSVAGVWAFFRSLGPKIGLGPKVGPEGANVGGNLVATVNQDLDVDFQIEVGVSLVDFEAKSLYSWENKSYLNGQHKILWGRDGFYYNSLGDSYIYPEFNELMINAGPVSIGIAIDPVINRRVYFETRRAIREEGHF